VTPVVIDASAGVELAADIVRGRALRSLLPAGAVPWVPELFYVECGAVLRRWDLNGTLTPAQISQAIGELMAWPLPHHPGARTVHRCTTSPPTATSPDWTATTTGSPASRCRARRNRPAHEGPSAGVPASELDSASPGSSPFRVRRPAAATGGSRVRNTPWSLRP
jgi:hypothetical protein